MTVQSNVLKILNIVDPTMEDMTVTTASNISTWNTNGGDKFPSSYILSIYNRARMALFNAIDNTFSLQQKIVAISGTVVKKSDLAFSSGVASKPTGFIQTVKMTNAAGTEIMVLPLSQYRQVKSLESAYNLFVFDYTTSFNALSATYITNASTYILYYYGISDFVATDITNGTTVETFNENYSPMLIELAVAIANEQGMEQVNQLAVKLIGGK